MTEADRRANAMIVRAGGGVSGRRHRRGGERARQRETLQPRAHLVRRSARRHQRVRRQKRRVFRDDRARGRRPRAAGRGAAAEQRQVVSRVWWGRARWLEQAGQQRALASATSPTRAQLGLIVSRSHRPGSTAELMQRLGITRETQRLGRFEDRSRSPSSNADLYVHMSDKSSAWDTCAPEAMLVAAGGRFTDLVRRDHRVRRHRTCARAAASSPATARRSRGDAGGARDARRSTAAAHSIHAEHRCATR